MTRNLLIVSTSSVYGKPYLEYMATDIQAFFSGVKEVVFIPYARPGGITYDEYTAKAKAAFNNMGFEMRGIHEFDDPVKAIQNAEGVFTGGGNTFELLRQLYLTGVIQELRNRIFEGLPYMGTSAGSNITGLTINTTNDMPIVYPPSFEAIAAVPFNINPHYLDPVEGDTHMGETRETRIGEFHHYNDQPVLGIREGSALLVKDNEMQLLGELTARIFEKNKEPYELSYKDDFSVFLK